MPEREDGDRLAQLLLPYCRRDPDDTDEPDHEMGWWFTGAPPDVVREALTLVETEPGERPNEQPSQEWLVAQAAHRGGVLAGFACPADPASPRMRVDAIIVPCAQARDLAGEIDRLWPLEMTGTALDLAVVAGLTGNDAESHRWTMSGSEFLSWAAEAAGWLGAACCSFWWD